MAIDPSFVRVRSWPGRVAVTPKSGSDTDHRPVSTVRRDDIQGLRAVAVLSVIAYHAGLSVPGGFTGVDVFFVISGFVITAMLLREHERYGHIRLGRFYLRRFKRLTPALALMTVVVLAFTAVIVSPLGPQQIAGQTAAGAMAFIANIVIARTTGGYFDDAADSNPFLHTWSLSVEEQFYLVFPALLGAIWLVRRVRSAMLAVVALTVVTVVSFGAAVYGSQHGSSGGREIVGFYSTFSRAWEFGLGALIALGVPWLSRRRSVLLALCALVGAAVMIAGFALIDGSRPFPGVWALLPTLGTALVIIGGLRGPRGAILRALSSWPMVRVGDWSYSLYLWHWPLIVFATMIWPSTSWAPAAAAIVAFGLAIASYRFVEEPLRRRTWGHGVRRVGSIGIVFIAPITAGAAVIAVADRYWKPRYEDGRIAASFPGDIGNAAFFSFINENFPLCADPTMQANARRQPFLRDLPECYQQRTGIVDTVLMGDSHAEHFFPGLALTLSNANVAYYFTQDRPYWQTPTTKRVLAAIDATPSVKTVIVNAWWIRDEFAPTDLVPTLRALNKAGRNVFVLDDVPNYQFSPFGCKYRQMPLLPPTCSAPGGGLPPNRAESRRALEQAVAEVPGVRLIDTFDLLCQDERCSMVAGERLAYRDGHHLNIDGSRYVMARMLEQNPDVASALGGVVRTASTGEAVAP